MANINIVERVLEKRTDRGATDKQLISWLESLKESDAWKKSKWVIDSLISAVKQTPLKRGLTRSCRETIIREALK